MSPSGGALLRNQHTVANLKCGRHLFPKFIEGRYAQAVALTKLRDAKRIKIAIRLAARYLRATCHLSLTSFRTSVDDGAKDQAEGCRR
jgi:hypothetical protein